MNLEDDNKYTIPSNDEEYKELDPITDFTQLRQDWEPETDEIVKQTYVEIRRHMIQINKLIAQITDRKAEQLKNYRIKNKDDDKLRDTDLKYLYNHEVLHNVYNFIRISKNNEKAYLLQAYEEGKKI